MEHQRISTEDGNLEDANFAGTEFAHLCTLILTVGKAAASSVTAGIAEVEGFNRYGIYAIVGDMPNVRTSAKYLEGFPENSKPDNIRKALGLVLGNENFGCLRYGKVMLATGQNTRCLKIKALVVNFFHKYWPTLLHIDGFLQQLIIPTVIVSDRQQPDVLPTVYYSLFDFERANPTYDPERDVRVYESLESFSPTEIREFFSDLEHNVVQFRYEDQDDEAIISAFGVDANRRQWLGNLQNPFFDGHLYYGNNGRLTWISYKYLIIREYSLWCHESTRNSIPSVLDGLVPDQRKVLHVCLNRYSDRRVSVLKLVGSVCEGITYRGRCDKIGNAVVRMAQDFVGRGNINLLLPHGQFGTRVTEEKDSGKIQYLQTELSDVAKCLFRVEDSDILEYGPSGSSVEPLYYLPVIPLILINGTSVNGYGWKTNIPMYHPVDVIINLHHMLNGFELVHMIPWFKNFKGIVGRRENERYVIKGCAEVLDDHRVRITELPVGTWTHSYKINTLDRMVPNEIILYLDRHTDTAVDFEVTTVNSVSTNPLQLLRKFSLIKTKTCNCTSYDEHGNLKPFSNVTQVLRHFFDLRLRGYERRRQRMIDLSNNPEDRDRLQNTLAKNLWRRDLLALLQRPEIKLGRSTTDLENELITILASAEAVMDLS